MDGFTPFQFKGYTIHFSSSDVKYTKMIEIPKEDKFDSLKMFEQTKTYREAKRNGTKISIPFRIFGDHGCIIDEKDKWIVYGTVNLIRLLITPFIYTREDSEDILARIKDI